MKGIRGVICIILALLVLALLFLAQPALANSSYTYQLNHNLELQLDGDFNFRSNVVTPSQGAVDMALDGDGAAYLKSELSIIEINQVASNWFDLF